MSPQAPVMLRFCYWPWMPCWSVHRLEPRFSPWWLGVSVVGSSVLPPAATRSQGPPWWPRGDSPAAPHGRDPLRASARAAQCHWNGRKESPAAQEESYWGRWHRRRQRRRQSPGIWGGLLHSEAPRNWNPWNRKNPTPSGGAAYFGCLQCSSPGLGGHLLRQGLNSEGGYPKMMSMLKKSR